MHRVTIPQRLVAGPSGAATILASLLVMPLPVAAQSATTGTADITLDPVTRLELINARALWVDYRGRRALKLAPLEGREHATDQEMAAVLAGSEFRDGVIEVDVAGARRDGYATDNASAFKGFIGVSFRIRGDSAERFYLRTENARLESQLFRNRSTQYEAVPAWPWNRLRQEQPGVYESYVDLEPGAWTRLRIEVSGTTARLYVNGATQPALVVDDLRHGESRGAIGLWARISSDAYFSNLRVMAHQPAGALPAIDTVLNGRADLATWRGVRALKLVPAPGSVGTDGDMLAILNGPEFKDGTIELAVAGSPRPGADPGSRGFIGVSVRTGARGEWAEVFYLRPTNARANDQLRRNHAVQYMSHPDHPWHRLRQESPGVYESYADMEAGAWTSMRIVVAGTTARLYINGASEPSLVVNDLKHGDTPGRVALWAHVDTEAYFGPVMVRRR